MKRVYTVELRSSPIADLSDEAVARLADEILDDGRLLGPVPSADLALHVFELRTAVKADGAAGALELAIASFMRAAKRAKVDAVDVVDASVWIHDASEHDRRELLSGADIADRLGISRQRVAQLVAEKGRFPRPAATFGTVSVWHWGDVADWIRAGGRGEPHRLDAGSAALEIIMSGDDGMRRAALFRRLIALANSGDETAVNFLRANPDRAFFDGRQWVEQADSGRGAGIAVARDSIVRTR